MEIISPQKQITLTKGISKFESIGKKGKLKKMISITLEHFEFLKSNLNAISFKILAYIIKGFFLTIKKSYENFFRDVQLFLESNINGVKQKVKRQIDEKAPEIFTMNGISLISDETQFDKILSNPLFATQINKTIKKICNNSLT